MEKELVGKAKCLKETIYYYLIAETALVRKCTYGVMIQYGAETCCITSISTSRSRVQSFLDLLIRGKVTPGTALDVFEDWSTELNWNRHLPLYEGTTRYKMTFSD